MSNEMGVWVFNGSGRRYPNLPSALFFSRQDAEKWIGKYSVSGLLTRYPVNTSVYDWAIEQEFFLNLPKLFYLLLGLSTLV